jgi:transaldolase
MPRSGSLIPETILDRLRTTSSGLEIWWDSSPLIYPGWSQRLIAGFPESRREVLAEQLRRLYDPSHPAETLFTGVTTNPPLSYLAIHDDPARWSAWVREHGLAHPHRDATGVGWALYREIVRQGAELFRPVYEASDHSYGHLSAQVNPYTFFDADAMLGQALDLRALGPNIAIKIPGTLEGMQVISKLTALGVSTNCTAAYTVPQFIAAADAVQAGLLEARANGVDLTGWRSVVTYMSARWEGAAEFEQQAAEQGLTLSPEDRRWAGVAIFKQAYRIFRERAYPSKMLICSLRMGPVVDGSTRCWHLEETAGARAVFTLPPSFLTELFTKAEHLTFEPRIRRGLPADVMERLQKIPYFNAAYQPDGLTPPEFNHLPPLLSTWKEFKEATDKIVAFAAQVMSAGGSADG